ncbi:MAG: Fic family protein [Sutterella wadsworthensis]|nr:Fic family protein [Sutterella wadsworthensis]
MHYQPDFLTYKPIFKSSEKELLLGLSKQYSLQNLIDNPRQFQDSSIEYSFVSSKIEGNAYTLKDTVNLIKFGYTAGSKTFNDALMIKNINQAFDEICNRKHAIYPVLSKPFLCGLHETVSHDLLPKERCGVVRKENVSITGSHYIPLSGEALLDAELEVLLKVANTIDDVFERAVYTHLNLAYLQYFLDGNNRTARLMQTAILADQGIMPLLLRVEDIIPYQTSVLEYYETGNYSSYAQLFVNGYQYTIALLQGQTQEQIQAQKLAEQAILARGR